jgi:hypothetical protein
MASKIPGVAHWDLARISYFVMGTAPGGSSFSCGEQDAFAEQGQSGAALRDGVKVLDEAVGERSDIANVDKVCILFDGAMRLEHTLLPLTG